MDFFLQTQLRNLADLTMFMISVLRHIMTQKRFTLPIAQFVKNIVHDQLQAATVQVPFQKAVRAPHDDRNLSQLRYCQRVHNHRTRPYHEMTELKVEPL